MPDLSRRGLLLGAGALALAGCGRASTPRVTPTAPPTGPARERLTALMDAYGRNTDLLGVSVKDLRTQQTFAFRGDDVTWALLERVANIARRTHACLRVVTFAIRGRSMRPSLVGTAVAEDMVLNSFVEQATAEQEKARAQLDRMGFPAEEYSFELSVGRSWGTAIDKLDWVRGEVLVVGSSSNHYLGRVFLGSSASKIVRHSPVPVVVVP